jgi:predicted nucleic acid-binding protein
MSVFIDTTAFYAYYDADDLHHPQAVDWMERLLARQAILYTTNYILVEATVLLQRRLGLAWAERLQTEARPLLQVIWVDEAVHEAAMSAVMAANQRDLSLVDCVSFQVMQSQGLRHALAFDRHFTDRGYTLPPLEES